jgi:hypothetical protein
MHHPVPVRDMYVLFCMYLSVTVCDTYVLFCMYHSLSVRDMYVLFCMYLSVTVRDMYVYSACITLYRLFFKVIQSDEFKKKY